MNVRLNIEYDGTDYLGWQIQDHGPTIQGEIEKAIAKIEGKRVPIKAAGRTDSGVHAKGQVANFFSDKLEPKKWQRALNAILPAPIRITRSEEVEKDFDSNTRAVSKIYQYRVLNRSYASALETRVCYYAWPIDWDRVESALPYFLGEHDFSCFQGAGSSVKTTVRTVLRFELDRSQEKEGLYTLEVEGTGFLKQMVRAMVGTALEVGEGRRSAESITEVIASRDRTKAGRTAPANGLCLALVKY